MSPVRYSDPALLLRDGAALFARQPAACSKIGRLLARMMDAPLPEDAGAYLAAVREKKRVVAVAVASRGATLLLAGNESAAVSAIARDIHEWDPELRGIVAAVPLAQCFAREWRVMTGREHRMRAHLREYVLDRKPAGPPAAVAGSLRAAREDDSTIVYRWQQGFVRELNADQSIERLLARQLQRLARQELWLWIDGQGSPAAMAAYAHTPPLAARIAPVYTPPSSRGRGYATALVSALCRKLMDEGRQAIFLAADHANPVSNGIYQKIGFRPEGEHYHFEFAAHD